MNIDIANMALSIGEKTEGIDWGAAIVTFGSVFFGALLAYYCSKLQEKHNEKKKQAINYVILCARLGLVLKNLIDYKIMHIDSLKSGFEENKIEKILPHFYFNPNIIFDFNISEYFFISIYNSIFIEEVQSLKRQGDELYSALVKFHEYLANLPQQHDQNIQIYYSELKQLFDCIYHNYEDYCSKVYAINKQLVRGCDKFFNINYYEGMEDNFKSFVKIEDYIQNSEIIKNIKDWEDNFDKYWMIDVNIFCHCCFWIRKMRYTFKSILNYFKKPKICKNCRCCKIKVEKK